MSEKKYILAVDDEAINLDIMKELLEGDYDLTCVSCGEACIQSIMEKIPELILLDVNMPGLNGLEVCQQIRAEERSKNIPIVFVSALANDSERLAGYDAGGDDYVTKPFDEDELLHKIKLQIANQEQKKILQSNLVEAKSTLMTTIASSSELSSVILFLRESSNCLTIENLAEACFATLKELEIDGCLYINAFNKNEFFYSRGTENIDDINYIGKNYKKERVITDGKKVLFNMPCGSLLIPNMPDDEDKLGRYRDHLALLVDALDARVNGIKYELEVTKKQQKLVSAVQIAQENLVNINKRSMQERLSHAQVLSDLGLAFEDLFPTFSLSESQEETLISEVAKVEQRTSQSYDESLKIDDQFNQVILDLKESISL
jgi:CheY-like chemotaxis protein